MGRKLHFKAGSFYRTSDRTGFVVRAENTRKQWDNLLVEPSVWEPRQPQDLVRGVPDWQSVPEARPLGQNVYVGPLSTQLTAAAAVGATVLTVQDTTGFQTGLRIGCVTDFDNGAIFFTTLDGFTATTLTLHAGLRWPMSNGNLVTLYKPSSAIAPVLPP